jgi:hypothetical protein
MTREYDVFISGGGPAGEHAAGPFAGRRVRLRGRSRQCGTVDRLLTDVRAGRSRALVIRGEPGIGKTALLGYAADSAADFGVARAAGVESEMELPFAALQQLCGPMLDRLDRLPSPQREALAIAFGLRAGGAPDRFLLGLGVLSLLSDVPRLAAAGEAAADEAAADAEAASVPSATANAGQEQPTRPGRKTPGN